MSIKSILPRIFIVLVLVVLTTAVSIAAQTTAFNFQGDLFKIQLSSANFVC